MMSNETPELQNLAEVTALQVEYEAVRVTKPDSVARVIEALKLGAESTASASELAEVVEAFPSTIGTSSEHLEREIIRKRKTNSGSIATPPTQKSLANLSPSQKRAVIVLAHKKQRLQRVVRLGILTSIYNSSPQKPFWLQDDKPHKNPLHGR